MMFNTPNRAYSLTFSDSTVLMDSASGGAFTALSLPILLSGGVVYAARLLDDGSVRHEAIKTVEQLSDFRGSIYAQSDASRVFADCIEMLGLGKRVLFVGTPCQVAALTEYLKARKASCELGVTQNLVLCDLICHGVPSQELLKAYFKWLSDKSHADDGIHGYKFRSKKRGWGLYYYYYYYYRRGKRVEVLDSAENDPYFRAFNAGLTFRDSCYSCPFARLERVSDVTIGDFWGVEKVLPAAANPKGVSLVLVNTAKGERYLLDECASKCNLAETEPAAAAKYNHNLNSPSILPAGRDALMDAMANKVAQGCLQNVFNEELRVPLTPKRLAKAVLPKKMLEHFRGRK